MKPTPADAAVLSRPAADVVALSGCWTARGIAPIQDEIAAVGAGGATSVTVEGGGIAALDTAGAWLLHDLLTRLRDGGAAATVHGLRVRFATLLELVAAKAESQRAEAVPAPAGRETAYERLGVVTEAILSHGYALLAFVGESSVALAGCLRQPRRFRWRTILYNVRLAGLNALPIVGLLSFMLGVVVAYQGADQLRHYGANIFVVDLVGLSMVREFAPLITAIIVAGRSGSAYAAQIGTMQVTEEIDAMRTLGIEPLEQLVLPKFLALVVTLPLLTAFADFLGVVGGMVMAQAQLGVGFNEFLERFVKAVSITDYTVGLGKAPVFAAVIALVGCYQGFQTRGGADSVGRQTTRAVVQSIVLVIMADGSFSVAFSALGL